MTQDYEMDQGDFVPPTVKEAVRAYRAAYTAQAENPFSAELREEAEDAENRMLQAFGDVYPHIPW